MTCVSRLCVIEYGNPDVEVATWDEVLVVFAAGHEIAAGDERPVAVLPMRGGVHVVAVTGIIADMEHPGENGADRNLCVRLGRIRPGVLFDQPPARSIIDARIRIRIPV